MRCVPGDAVRTVHGSLGMRGVVLRRVEDSTRDGGERWLVRWTHDDGSVAESRWAPELLVPLDTPRESDPPVVFVGVSSDGKWKTWLTRKGMVHTRAETTERDMLLVDGLALDVVYSDRPDQ